MRLYAYILICLSMIAVGWFYRGEHDAKEYKHELQKAEQRFETQRTRQEKERQDLEKQIASDRQKSEQRLGKLFKENSKLRAEANANVDLAFLIYSRLCEADDCALLYGPLPAQTPPPTEGRSTVSTREIYDILRTLDEQIITHNLGLEQLKIQLNSCRS